MPVVAAREQTVATLLSGPASGVIGAAYVASQAGLPNVITLDVGGTSADIAVVENGRPRVSTSEHVGGVPVMMPVVGVTAIGAGGGSVAWVDDVGVPKVGPQSTGAHPGPACYGRGGTEATLTDAFLVSGFLDPAGFLGGRMPLDRGLAEEAIARFADLLGMTPHEAAESVVRVAVSNMYAEFTKILSRAAVDPRDFALVAFGGAGPVVGALLAREVGIPTVFVPRSPGTLCALGAHQRGHRERRGAQWAASSRRVERRALPPTPPPLFWRRRGERSLLPRLVNCSSAILEDLMRARCARTTTLFRPSWLSGWLDTAPGRGRRSFSTRQTCATWGSRTRSRCRSSRAGSCPAAARRSWPRFIARTSAPSATRTARRRRRS